MSDSRVFEVDLIVRAHGQEDARISREYVTSDKASTDGVASEIWNDGVCDVIKAKCRPVSDGD